MVKRLPKHGNSLALVIDRPILDTEEVRAGLGKSEPEIWSRPQVPRRMIHAPGFPESQ